MKASKCSCSPSLPLSSPASFFSPIPEWYLRDYSFMHPLVTKPGIVRQDSLNKAEAMYAHTN